MKRAITKFLGAALCLALVISLVSSLGTTQVQAGKKVKINKKELTLNTFEWKKLKLKHCKYSKEEIKWTSSDKAVAKVSKKGWVKGLVGGECTITATIPTGKQYTCHVTVVAPDASSRHIDPEKPIVALTFDDGPSIYTSGLIDTLESYGVTATFFMCNDNCGSNLISSYSDLIRRMYNSGMEIANHTLHHPNLNTSSSEKIKSEIHNNADKIRSIIGEDKRVILRPPYGNYNDTVKSIANTPLIIWSIDTQDWSVSGKSTATDTIMKNLKAEIRDGGIILMHDIHKTSCESIPTVLNWLISNGYQVCSVSEMFAARGVALENGEVYSKCITAEQYKAQKNQ